MTGINNKYIYYLIIIALTAITLLILLSPIFGLFIIFFMFYFVSNNIIKTISYPAVLFGSFMISVVNINRYPTSDLATYIERYHNYGILSIGDFFLTVKADFIFYFINNGIYYITDGSNKAFIFMWSFTIYMLLSSSLYLLFKYDYINKTSFIFSLIILFFSTTFLSLSSHLIRQMVAGSIFVFYLTNLYIGHYKKYLLFIMVGIHFSSIILLFYPLLKRKYFLLFIVVITIFILFTGTNIFSLIFTSLPTFNIDFLNFLMSQINGAMNKVKDDGNVPFVIYLVSISMLSFLTYRIYLCNKKKEKIFFIPFLYTFMLFNLFAPIQLLWLRFSFYQYPFYFIIFALLFEHLQKINRLFYFLYLIASLFYFIIFINYFDTHIWVDSMKKIDFIEESIFKFLGYT